MTSGVSPLLPLDQYIASLARKRMAAGALFRDKDGRVLLVDQLARLFDMVQQVNSQARTKR
jgi:hypothetical protein